MYSIGIELYLLSQIEIAVRGDPSLRLLLYLRIGGPFRDFRRIIELVGVVSGRR
jgi:hypothetical protein